MAKKKFYVETISEYLGEFHDIEADRLYSIHLKVSGDLNPAETEIKSVKNAGGEAWDWATAHWPEFIPEDGPCATLACGDGVTVTVPTKLRWACIQGVYKDSEKKEFMPIEEINYKSGKNANYGIQDRKKRGGSVPVFKTQAPPAKKTKKKKKYPADTSSSVKPANNPKQQKVADVLNFDDMKRKKMEEALAKDD